MRTKSLPGCIFAMSVVVTAVRLAKGSYTFGHHALVRRFESEFVRSDLRHGAVSMEMALPHRNGFDALRRDGLLTPANSTEGLRLLLERRFELERRLEDELQHYFEVDGQLDGPIYNAHIQRLKELMACLNDVCSVIATNPAFKGSVLGLLHPEWKAHQQFMREVRLVSQDVIEYDDVAVAGGDSSDHAGAGLVPMGAAMRGAGPKAGRGQGTGTGTGRKRGRPRLPAQGKAYNRSLPPPGPVSLTVVAVPSPASASASVAATTTATIVPTATTAATTAAAATTTTATTATTATTTAAAALAAAAAGPAPVWHQGDLCAARQIPTAVAYPATVLEVCPDKQQIRVLWAGSSSASQGVWLPAWHIEPIGYTRKRKARVLD